MKKTLSFGVAVTAVAAAIMFGTAGAASAAHCVDGAGTVIMPCGRCRQLLWEHGGAALQVLTPDGVRPMTEVLPQAFGPGNLTGGTT